MCGFFGTVSIHGAYSEQQRDGFRKAASALQHRGPDSFGDWYTQNAYLGHCRLSIIDLSDAANQPYESADARYSMVYNGEIYNYIELRERLISEHGMKFKTESDTEVCLNAFIAWGEDAFQHFDGMFAGAIHDRKTQSTYLFRDHLGQKPLYYYQRGDELLFASELRSILSVCTGTLTLDKKNLARYIACGYYALDSTPVVGVKKLLPGHYLSFDASGLKTTRYWSSRPQRKLTGAKPETLMDEFESKLSASCKIAMRSDVPYGVFLSGGIDSSLILAYCAKHDPSVQCLSVGMEDKDFDESENAAAVARHLGVKNFHKVTMSQDQISDVMEKSLHMLDEPHADPGLINARFVSEESRKYFKVALSGDGGDEFHYGYLAFKAMRYAKLMRAFPDAVSTGVAQLCSMIPSTDQYMGLRFKAEGLFRGLPSSPGLEGPLWLMNDDTKRLARLMPNFGESFFTRDGTVGTLLEPEKTMLAQSSVSSSLQQLAEFYQTTFLPEFVCHHTDRAAMQVGLEVRSPFLSPGLAEFANDLPDNLKFHNGTSKWFLRQAARRVGLPDHIVNQKKRGFTFPLARWLKTGLRDKMNALLDADSIRSDGLFDGDEVERLKNAHLSGAENNYRVLYSPMVFQAWRKKYPDVALGPS